VDRDRRIAESTSRMRRPYSGDRTVPSRSKGWLRGVPVRDAVGVDLARSSRAQRIRHETMHLRDADLLRDLRLRQTLEEPQVEDRASRSSAP
jgi:hypothetical protein